MERSGADGVLSSNPLDSNMGIAGGSISGASAGSVSGPMGAASGSVIGNGSTGSVIKNIPMEAGVKVEFFSSRKELYKRCERYDKITVFNTNIGQDRAIRNNAYSSGKNFGEYNLFSNNCTQYATGALGAGGE